MSMRPMHTFGPVMCFGAWLVILPVTSAAADELTLQSLRVGEGFTVELVAAAPLVEHPVMAGFDDRGRLFVADNAGLNLSAEELAQQRPNMIRMLEDTDGDGCFDRSSVFADKMTFPQGAAWFRGALYVASPPEIWRLEDTDGDGAADKREQLVQNFGYTGNAASVHGCFITPTGRIAWCDGRHGHKIRGPDGELSSEGLAARVFRCRADGSDVETFCGGGMDNPVEVAFTSTGDTIGTMTFYNPDSERHDALAHFVYGGVYPRQHPCTSEFKQTGELMPALRRFGVVAPSGLTRYAGAAWGEEYRDNLFSVQFNTHKVVRHVLRPQGATYSCADEDFLVADNVDFHPTDVLQDADGSLLVIDTGGWFRIGCPTSQMAKPEIGGAIYRIRRADAPAPTDPRGLAMDWDRVSDTEMADLLGDARPAVAERTIEILASRGDGAMGALANALFENPNYRARQNATWALARDGSDNARMLLRQVLSDDDPRVRQAAAHAVADLRDAGSVLILIELVASDEPPIKREAATALGRIGDPVAVPTLLDALASADDRFLEHALIYALIEINDRESTLAGLAHDSAAVRRASLIALDQMDDGHLTQELIAPLLDTNDAALLRTIVDVLTGHPDWTEEITSAIGAWLALRSPSNEQLATARGAVVALARQPGVEKLVAGALASEATSRPVRLMLLEALAAVDYDQPPSAYDEALRHNLESSDQDVVQQTILATRALDARPLSEPLIAIGLDPRRPAALRTTAFQAASHACPELPTAGYEFLAGRFGGANALGERLAAAEALGRSTLNEDQLHETAELIASCGALEVSWLLQAFERGASQDVGLALVEALARSPGLESVSGMRLRQTLANYPDAVRSTAQELVARHSASDAQRAAKIDNLAAATDQGDVALGEDVFFSSRTACSACHRIEERGERIGPDLSNIGQVRDRRDLAEALLFPSASLARGYESFQVVTTDGKLHTGMLGRETASAIYLRTPERAEIRVSRAAIDEMQPSSVSIMPEGLDKTLSDRELAALLAYLRSRK